MESTNKGKVKKYLLYALGEILLVMIGILLALQVNNWNQNRIERKEEAKALVDLLEEIKLNQQRIEEKQNLRIAVVPRLEKYINQLKNGNADYKAFETFHKKQFLFGMTNPSNGVIDALISSGGLKLITNDSLKYLLADWKDQAGNLFENEKILWDVSLDYSDYYTQFIIAPDQNWNDWNDKKRIESFNLLKSKIPYRNKLTSYQACNKVVIEECKIILESIEEIKELIRKEVK